MNSGRLGFLSILGLIFITLKLLKVITWSWWWVLAPIWIPWGIFFGFLALFGLLFVVFGRKPKRRRF